MIKKLKTWIVGLTAFFSLTMPLSSSAQMYDPTDMSDIRNPNNPVYQHNESSGAPTEEQKDQLDFALGMTLGVIFAGAATISVVAGISAYQNKRRKKSERPAPKPKA